MLSACTLLWFCSLQVVNCLIRQLNCRQNPCCMAAPRPWPSEAWWWCFQVTNWFTKTLSYQYNPGLHGNVAEWLSDLISISFTEPPKYFKRSMRSIKVPQHACYTILVMACLLGVQPTVFTLVSRHSATQDLECRMRSTKATWLATACDAQSSCTRTYGACDSVCVGCEQHVGKQPHSSPCTVAPLTVNVAPSCLVVWRRAQPQQRLGRST